MNPIWYFVARFELVTAGAVTRPAEVELRELDAKIERDPAGRFWVPGTSVAGSLRAHFSAHLDEAVVRRLLGWVDDAAKGRSGLPGSRVAGASVIRILGTRTDSSPDQEVVTTAQTAIDRRRRAARTATLRTGEFMPAGTVVTVYASTESEEARDALRQLLPSWRPLIGRGRTNGFGRTRTLHLAWGALERSDRAGLAAWLSSGGPDFVERVAVIPLNPAEVDLGEPVTVEVSIADPLMIRAGKPARQGIGATVTRVLRRNGRPIVPATSLRGVVRSQLEFILRSAGGTVCSTTDCGRCWTCEVFGFGGNRGTGEPGRRARVRFRDSEFQRYGLATRSRNSIDRFTGGAADQRLWQEEVVTHGSFRIEIEPWPLPGDADPGTVPWWEELRVLLLLVWRDVNDGYCRLGGGVTTGHGRLSVSAAVDPDATVAALDMLRRIADRSSEVAV